MLIRPSAISDCRRRNFCSLFSHCLKRIPLRDTVSFVLLIDHKLLLSIIPLQDVGSRQVSLGRSDHKRFDITTYLQQKYLYHVQDQPTQLILWTEVGDKNERPHLLPQLEIFSTGKPMSELTFSSTVLRTIQVGEEETCDNGWLQIHTNAWRQQGV